MSVIVGNTGKNQAEIVANNQNLARVYVGDKLVWQKLNKQFLFSDINLGMYYNYQAATDIRKITSSDDWIIGSNFDFDEIKTTLGVNPGYSLTEADLSYWSNIDGCTNNSGFNGRGAGTRAYTDGSFNGLMAFTAFWSSSIIYPGYGCSYGLYVSDHSIFLLQNTTRLNSGISIRLMYTGNDNPSSYIGSDGKVYPIIKIGGKWWTAANLAETKFRDGSLIPIVTDNNAWINLSTAGACYPNGDPDLV